MKKKLFDAIREADVERVKLFLENDQDIDAKASCGGAVLHVAGQIDHAQIARLLIEKKIEVNAQDDNGKTVLHLVAKRKHSDVLKILLETGASLNMLDNYGNTPLFEAVDSRNTNNVRLLLEAGADPNLMWDEYTPLLYARLWGYSRIVQLLKQHGAKSRRVIEKNREVPS